MARRTRREFLEDSLFAATAAMAAGSAVAGVGSSAYADDSDQSSSPNEKLRIAILGMNGRGKTHRDEFARRKDCDIVAIVDPDEAVGMSNGVEWVEKHTGQKPAFYTDLRKAFDDKNIDVIAIATPNHWHSLGAIWAMQAGKDVYVEKPVSHNVSEGRRAVEAARKYNRICQAGTQCRSMAGSVDGIRWVQDGKIGEVKLARGLCYKPRGAIGPRGNYDVPASVDYSVYMGPAPLEPLTRPRFHYDWHWQWACGNGDLGNQGIHQMDLARWGLGVDHIGDSVVAYGGRLGYEDAGETANTQVSIHTFGDKRLVFETRGLKTDDLKGAKIGVIFYGSEGYVVLDRYNHGAAFDLDGNMVQEFKGGQTADHFANFVDVVRSRKVEDLRGDILEGHLSSALCHLGNISYRLGTPMVASQITEQLQGDEEALETFDRTAQHLSDNGVDITKTPLGFGPNLKLDGKQEVFTGEHATQANAMLTREYRAPFVVPETAQL